MVIIIGLLLAVSDEPSNTDIVTRQEMILDNQRIILCLLLYPAEQRTEEVVAGCSASTPSAGSP